MRRLVIAALVVVAVCVVAGTAMAAVASAGNGNDGNANLDWKVYSLGASGQTYTTKPASMIEGGSGFAFTTAPDTRLMMTKHPGDLLGDLTGKTLKATFKVVGDAPEFTYYGEGKDWNPCGTPASVRLYFEGNTNGSFTYDSAGYSKYWWSNPDAYTLTSIGAGEVELSVPLTTDEWSNWGGQLASNVPANFNDAVADVSGVGLSFGGGCFFANGVGLDSGSASFVLTNYSAS
jgi:hypothetical protein